MTVRYAHLAPAHKLAAVDKLAEYRREQEKAERSKTQSIRYRGSVGDPQLAFGVLGRVSKILQTASGDSLASPIAQNAVWAIPNLPLYVIWR